MGRIFAVFGILKLWISLGIVASLCGVLLLALGRAATQPHTDREAVMAILDQRAIAYTAVQEHGAESGVPKDHFAYVAAVIVEAEPLAYGKIECLSNAGDCVLWIDALGLHQAPLPPLVPTSLWERINHQIDTVAVPLRAWLARVGHHRSAETSDHDVVPERRANTRGCGSGSTFFVLIAQSRDIIPPIHNFIGDCVLPDLHLFLAQQPAA